MIFTFSVFSWWFRHDTRFLWMINSFHFFCVEFHLSLFCTLSTVTIHRVCLACWLYPGTTVLRMCQAWMGMFVARQFPAFAQPGVYPNFFRMSCEIFMFRGTERSSTSTTGGSSRLSIGQGTSGRQYKSSNVISSGIAFTALDLLRRPSPFRATICFSVWKRFPSHVTRRHLSVRTPPGTFPATLNIAAVPNGKSTPRCVSSIAHTQICPQTPHGTCSECLLHVEQSTGTPASEQKWDSRLDLKDQKESLLSSPRLT